MAIATANVTNGSAANVYVSSGNTAVTWLSLTNITAGNVLVNVYVVPSGGTAGLDNLVAVGVELTASGANTGDTYQLYVGNEKLLLSNGDSIQANSNAASSITSVCSYTNV